MESEISKLQEENAKKVKGEGVLAAVNVPASDANAQGDGYPWLIGLSRSNEATGIVTEETERHHTSFQGNRCEKF